MKKSLIAGALVFAALYPATAGAATFKGTVVASQGGAPRPRGDLEHGARPHRPHELEAAKAGSVVSVSAAVRPDGTFTASRVAVVGHAKKAHIQGVVVAVHMASRSCPVTAA